MQTLAEDHRLRLAAECRESLLAQGVEATLDFPDLFLEEEVAIPPAAVIRS